MHIKEKKMFLKEHKLAQQGFTVQSVSLSLLQTHFFTNVTVLRLKTVVSEGTVATPQCSSSFIIGHLIKGPKSHLDSYCGEKRELFIHGPCSTIPSQQLNPQPSGHTGCIVQNIILKSRLKQMHVD